MTTHAPAPCRDREERGRIARLADRGWLTFLVALAVRLAVVAWAAPRIPPIFDGRYYDIVARRIAEGHGYTWLWEDGTVTYAAHYPVGYPAMIGGLYAVFGASPGLAMLLNATLGALAAPATQKLVQAASTTRRGLWAGGLVALHPGLVSYTPALMTEGVTGALLVLAAWAASRARASPGAWRWLALTGLTLGVAALVRPQSLLLAPLLALVAWAPVGGARAKSVVAAWRPALLGAVMVTGVTIAICAPWVARNCVRMDRCTQISVNGGWNLLIGADLEGDGSYGALRVPAQCETVFDEAGKDRCFGDAAVEIIRQHPGAWLALAPRKLGATFGRAGAGAWYLAEANPGALGPSGKRTLEILATLADRGILLGALAWAAGLRDRASGRRIRALRASVAGVGALFALTPWAWVAYLCLLVAGLLRGDRTVAALAGLSVLATTALVHVVFFGAGRYALVVVPLMCALACLPWNKRSF